MRQNIKVDRLNYFPPLATCPESWQGQVPAGVLPKASSDRSFGTFYSANEGKSNNRTLWSGLAVSDVAVW